MDHYKSPSRLSNGQPMSEAYTLDETALLDGWPAGTKCATGRSGGSLTVALALATEGFEEHFKRAPIMDKVLFRGAFMTFGCTFEIGEMQD